MDEKVASCEEAVSPEIPPDEKIEAAATDLARISDRVFEEASATKQSPPTDAPRAAGTNSDKSHAGQVVVIASSPKAR